MTNETLSKCATENQKELDALLERLVLQNERLSGIRSRLSGIVGRLDGSENVKWDETDPPVTGTLSRFESALSDYMSHIDHIKELVNRIHAIA